MSAAAAQKDPNPWIIPTRRSYPYLSRPIIVPSAPSDPYKRNVASLLASLGSFANKILHPPTEDFSLEEINRFGRVCNNSMSIDDYRYFHTQLFNSPRRTTSTVLHFDQLPLEDTTSTGAFPNLSSFQLIILSTLCTNGKLVWFRIVPSQSIIDVYCATTILYHEVQDTLNNLLKILSLAFECSFSVTLRLQLPDGFHPDPLFTALFLIAIIRRSGKYFSVSESTLLHYKLWLVREFIQFHDDLLGRLDVKSITEFSHPFQTPRRPRDQFNKLEKKGWHVLDVSGDGHCGYYSFFLGLQNIGREDYFVNTQHLSPRVGKTLWREKVMALRRRLLEGSRDILENVFPPGCKNRELEWWYQEVGACDDEDKKQLSDSFLIPRCKSDQRYFTDKFRDDPNLQLYHMNPYWAPLVFAYVFRVRVVVITRKTIPIQSEENSPEKNDNPESNDGKASEENGTAGPGTERTTTELTTTEENATEKNGTDESDTTDKCVTDGKTSADNGTEVLVTERTAIELIAAEDNVTETICTEESKEMHQCVTDGKASEDTGTEKTGTERIVIEDTATEKTTPKKRKFGYVHTTKIFDFDDGFETKIDTYVPVTSYEKLFRLDDAALYSKPTIELLYVTGFKTNTDADDNHFLFLRRILVGKVNPNLPISEITLRNFIMNQQQQSLPSPSTATNPETLPNSTNTGPDNGILNPSIVTAPASQADDSSNPPMETTRANEIPAVSQPPPVVEDASSVTISIPVPDPTTTEHDMESTRTNEIPAVSQPLPVPEDASTVTIAETVPDPTTTEHDMPVDSGPPITTTEATRTTDEMPVEESQDELEATTTIDEMPDEMPVEEPTHKLKAIMTTDDLITTNTIRENSGAKKRNQQRQDTNKRKRNVKRTKKTATPKKPYRDQHEDVENQSIISNTETPANVMYDPNCQRFFTARFDNSKKRYLDKTLIEDIDLIDPNMMEDAKKTPNTWVSLPLGDTCDDVPPAHLTTTVKCLYEQLDRPYCVTYCMANALFYCGFDMEARDLAAQASLLAHQQMNQQLEGIRNFLPNLVPSIGAPTVYGKRCSGNSKKKRSITWTDIFRDLTPYPTLVVPTKAKDGRMTHAFCVVDDLIFDSSASHALKLKMESVDWIFRNEEVDIFIALRFNQKVSPPGHKVRWSYKREVTRNWIWENDTLLENHKVTRLFPNKVYDLEFALSQEFSKIGIES
jgi:hypothetical protein